MKQDIPLYPPWKGGISWRKIPPLKGEHKGDVLITIKTKTMSQKEKTKQKEQEIWKEHRSCAFQI